jgi:hypothetical protein
LSCSVCGVNSTLMQLQLSTPSLVVVCLEVTCESVGGGWIEERGCGEWDVDGVEACEKEAKIKWVRGREEGEVWM